MLYNLDLASLHGLNNLRKFQYDFDRSKLSEIPKQLQTVSSSLISEVNFTFYHDNYLRYDDYIDLDDIDYLMIQQFPALLMVTIIWIFPPGQRITWDDCVSRSVKALPKVHAKGILCPLLSPPQNLK